MRYFKLSTILLSVIFFAGAASVRAASEPLVEYGDNYIVFEAEETTSDLGLWVKREPSDPKYYAGTTVAPVNETYLEFTGNTLNGGAATSPLTYTFTCPKTANYRLAMRMYQPLADNEAGDKRNDVYVKLEGNYTTACRYTKDILETDHKFWGRGVRVWGSCHALEAHVDGGRYLEKVVYKLTEGETYTFTMSGRAQGASIDYIILYEESLLLNVEMIDIAAANDSIYRPGLGLTEPTSLALKPNPAQVRIGTSIELDIEAEPINARKDVTWSTSNDTILTVDEYGVITAVGEVGEKATITASSTENTLEATCEVTIVDWYSIPIQSVQLSPDTINVVEGSVYNVEALVLPKYSDNDTLLWSSSDKSIATVDSTGKVTTISSGQVVIHAISKVDNTIYDSTIVEIEAFFEPFIAYDSEAKYYSGTFYSNDTMEVTCNYHAGNFATVQEGVKFWLREIGAGWSIASDPHNFVVTSEAGKTSGTVTYKIPLTGVKPTSQLSGDNFYFLFVSYKNSNGVDVNKGIDNPITILADPTSTGDLQAASELLVYPNPTADGFVNIEGLAEGDNNVRVFDMSGVEVYNTSLLVDENIIGLDLSHLQNGIYILVNEGNGITSANILYLNN